MDRATAGVEFVRDTLKPLVDYPDKLEVESTLDERGVLITVRPYGSDLGRVIGRNGSTAEALRILVRVLGLKCGAHFSVKVVESD